MLLTVTLSSAIPTYRERRRSLYEWQQQFVREGITDAPSIKAALDHMEALVNDIRMTNERQKRWRWAKRFFNFLRMTANVAAIGGPATATYAASGAALASFGAFVIDEAAQARGLKPDWQRPPLFWTRGRS
jgi:hypothetical protein